MWIKHPCLHFRNVRFLVSGSEHQMKVFTYNKPVLFLFARESDVNSCFFWNHSAFTQISQLVTVWIQTRVFSPAEL